jgi:hypothetical protein
MPTGSKSATAVASSTSTFSTQPAYALGQLPTATAGWQATGTDPNSGCGNHQATTSPVKQQNVVVHGRLLGVLSVYANPSPQCGLVWADFWTHRNDVTLADEGVVRVKLTFAQANTPSTADHVCEWTPDSDTCPSPGEVTRVTQETWTPAMRIVAAVDYSATVQITTGS